MAIEIFEGISTDSIIVITDPATAGSDRGNMGWLRSLPYLARQGVSTYTFNPSWLRYGSNETFDEVLTEEGEKRYTYTAVPDLEFTYHLVVRDQTPDDIHAQHLCQYTSNEIEQEGKSSTTHKLIRAYNDGHIDELLLVVDASDFRIDRMEGDKPLTEELDEVSELAYRGIMTYHLNQELPARYLGLDETLNVWLHEAAVEYANVMESEPGRIADLFEFDVLEPGIRTWDFLEFLASKTTRENTDHISATIRPWVERDITKIKNHILNALQTFDFEAESVREYRDGDA